MKRGIWALSVLPLLVLATPTSAQETSSSEPAAVEFVALTYNVAGLPEGLSSSKPTANSPLISPKLNDYDLVLLQEDWDEPIDIGGTKLLFHHDAVVAEADHAYRSDPAPAPLGIDLDRLPTGPPLIADGLNRLSDFPFDTVQRTKWDRCFGELSLTVVETILDAIALGEVGDSLQIYGGATDCNAQKGFSLARTTFGDGLVVDVYNLHAEAGSSPQDNSSRADNYVQLAEFINANSVGNAVILGGDTNLHVAGDDDRDVDSAVWDKFQAATGLVDVCATVDCGDDIGKIDKFAIRDGDDVSVRALSHHFERDVFVAPGGRALSDHDALAVRFEVSARADAAPVTSVDADAAAAAVQITPVETASGALPATGDSDNRILLGCVLAVIAVTAWRRCSSCQARTDMP